MKVKAMFFSPTGTTRKIVSAIAGTISCKLGRELAVSDFTGPGGRGEAPQVGADDIVIVGVPVYAGRVPNVLLQYLHTLAGEGAAAIAVVVYGNRNYDDALIELTDILDTAGFQVIGAGAFIGEHSFSRTLAKGRPDAVDLASAIEFAEKLVKKIADHAVAGVTVKGNRPYRGYYVPVSKEGTKVDIRKVVPKTSAACTCCLLCVAKCPMGSIAAQDPAQMTGICIKCGACIKSCPVQAKFFDDYNFLFHKHELEVEFARRREAEYFL